MPRIERAAAAAAERAINDLIDEVQGETTREKMQAILTRVDQLPADALETLFLRRPVMADALRRLLRRIEIEEDDGQWEYLARF
jgi:ribosomal protein S3AE